MEHRINIDIVFRDKPDPHIKGWPSKANLKLEQRKHDKAKKQIKTEWHASNRLLSLMGFQTKNTT